MVKVKKEYEVYLVKFKAKHSYNQDNYDDVICVAGNEDVAYDYMNELYNANPFCYGESCGEFSLEAIKFIPATEID